MGVPREHAGVNFTYINDVKDDCTFSRGLFLFCFLILLRTSTVLLFSVLLALLQLNEIKSTPREVIDDQLEEANGGKRDKDMRLLRKEVLSFTIKEKVWR